MEDQPGWNKTNQLEELRSKIDDLDHRIVELLNARAKVVIEIGKIKHANNEPIYVPSREKVVLKRVCDYNAGPLANACIEAVYRELISGSRALEKPLAVCFLGPKGTFSEAAAISKFGKSAEYVPAGTLSDIFDIVERGQADYGVVPVENSTQGGITETLGRFLDTPLKVCGEIVVRVRLSLLGRCKLSEVKRVYSKGVALGQCRQWLQKNLPHAELIETASTSLAAEHAVKEDGAAAVGRAELVTEYPIKNIRESIEDFPNNFTRFFVIGNHISDPTGCDKTALLCSVKDKSGALHDLLTPFKQNAINITKIESFPSPKAAFQYFFFIDFEGHVQDEKVSQALAEAEKECGQFRVLGAFPRG